jgi:hypothetical protein
VAVAEIIGEAAGAVIGKSEVEDESERRSPQRHRVHRVHREYTQESFSVLSVSLW